MEGMDEEEMKSDCKKIEEKLKEHVRMMESSPASNKTFHTLRIKDQQRYNNIQHVPVDKLKLS